MEREYSRHGKLSKVIADILSVVFVISVGGIILALAGRLIMMILGW